MNDFLFVNNLITWFPDTTKEYTERILWIENDGSMVYTIDINASEGFPVLKNTEDIENALISGDAIIPDRDIMLRVVGDESISDKDKYIRDKAWEIISEIVLPENEPDIFLRERRGPLISKAVKKYEVTYTTVYKYLRKFWQRGKNKNALLSDYCNSGGKGKSKKLGDKKIGRPRKNMLITGKGVNVDEATKKIFRLAINKYYNTPKENDVTTAYNLMLKEFYVEDYIFDGGFRKPILIPAEQIPTIDQFRYWLKKENKIVESIISRKGKRKYLLNHRAVTGKSDTNIKGPGYKYQIDATVADIYLKSRYNKDWIIGRPVIYVVIDVFTRLITGVYVGLEGPSWIGAMMALANAFSDKVEFCKEYMIDITEQQWPCKHIPQAILGDRGEMESRYADTLVNGLGIRIENTPPYRADWKGIVEQTFNILDENVKPFVPGHVDTDFRERGGKEYRLDAKLDINEFTRIIIQLILSHNNKHWMDNYEMDEEMIAADLNPVPISLWNWGIENRSGLLKSYPRDIVKLNLLPASRATVTANGIRFKNMYYSCDKALSEEWFDKARSKKAWKLDVAYDTRNMDYIYIKSEDNRSFQKCAMIDKKKYGNKTFEEIEYLDAYEKLKKEKNTTEILQSRIDIISEIENIVSEAELKSNISDGEKLSNHARLKGIRNNRKIEKEENRKTESFELGERDAVREDAKVIPMNEEISKDYRYPNHIDYLKQKQKERMRKKDE